MKKRMYLLLLGAVLGMSLLSFSPYATAVKKDPYEGYEHRILVMYEETWTFYDFQTSYVAYGWVITQEEFEMGMKIPPHIDYYIDGVQIETQRFANKIHDNPDYHSPIFMCYALFDAYTFAPGEHTFYCKVYTEKLVYNEFEHPFYVLSEEIPM